MKINAGLLQDNKCFDKLYHILYHLAVLYFFLSHSCHKNLKILIVSSVAYPRQKRDFYLIRRILEQEYVTKVESSGDRMSDHVHICNPD